MTTIDRELSRGWADTGTRLLLTELDRLDDADLDAASGLAGWSRRQLLAHVASNAEAIERLLTWARTGVETPMYSSLEQRATDIEQGALRPDLREWVRSSATRLATSMDQLPETAWQADVVTAQGRTVKTTETPWMRARETCIHAVDLDSGVTFSDLPEEFLIALLNDVVQWRSSRPGPAIALTTPHSRYDITGHGDPIPVNLPLAAAAAWTVGRTSQLPRDLPTLPRWL